MLTSFPRRTEADLLQWTQGAIRKPLVLRGARQVGKTTLLQRLGSRYDRFFPLNLEKPDIRQAFERMDTVSDLMTYIELRFGAQKTGQRTLLFLDEIQASPKAIRLLRYWHEDQSRWDVVAAGSFLEFALQDTATFPVGRVVYHTLHPVDFGEFLDATDQRPLGQALEAQVGRFPDAEDPTDSLLRSAFELYGSLGGMPEIVQAVRSGTPPAEAFRGLGDLWQGFRDDMSRYARNETMRRVIEHVAATAPLAEDRITMGGFGGSSYRSREVGEALRALDAARVVQLVYPSHQRALPLLPDTRKKPRLQFLDTGLLLQALGMVDGWPVFTHLNDATRGRVAMHLVIQQVQARQTRPDYRPVFWTRESPQANAEVDLLYPCQGLVLPIEVKAGKQGRLRSLHQFVDRADHALAIRFYDGPRHLQEAQTPDGKTYWLLNLPLYASILLPEWADWLVRKKG
jgi:predicted AAA+ superfamily ATPase